MVGGTWGGLSWEPLFGDQLTSCYSRWGEGGGWWAGGRDSPHARWAMLHHWAYTGGAGVARPPVPPSVLPPCLAICLPLFSSLLCSLAEAGWLLLRSEEGASL